MPLRMTTLLSEIRSSRGGHPNLNSASLFRLVLRNRDTELPPHSQNQFDSTNNFADTSNHANGSSFDAPRWGGSPDPQVRQQPGNRGHWQDPNPRAPHNPFMTRESTDGVFGSGQADESRTAQVGLVDRGHIGGSSQLGNPLKTPPHRPELGNRPFEQSDQLLTPKNPSETGIQLLTWHEASTRLAELGIDKFQLEAGSSPGTFLFSCLFHPKTGSTGDAPL